MADPVNSNAAAIGKVAPRYAKSGVTCEAGFS